MRAPRRRRRSGALRPNTAAFLALIVAAAAGPVQPASAEAFEETFASSGRSCGYPGLSYDMSRVEAAARGYPNGRVLILTPQEKAQLQEEFAAWNRGGGNPMREMASCFNYSREFEACIVFERPGAPRSGDEFASNDGPPPGEDFDSTGGGQPPGDSEACRKSPQSYTCLYGHPDTGDGGSGGGKGLFRDDCAEAAAKGLYRDDCEEDAPGKQPTGPRPTVSQLVPAINACLGESGITYDRSPATGATPSRVRYDPAGASVLYNRKFLSRQPPYVAAFWLADAYAAHVLNLEAWQFGVQRPPLAERGARDYLAGYIAHCLVLKNVLPRPGEEDDPRLQYRGYLRGGPFAMPGDPPRTAGDIEDWEMGWREYGMGVIFSLRHDPSLPPTPSDPFAP